jgi:hypothetical protein
MIFFYAPTTQNEYERYRQVSTFYSSETCVKMMNGELDSSIETLYPYNFNILRDGGSDKVFTENINNLETFK